MSAATQQPGSHKPSGAAMEFSRANFFQKPGFKMKLIEWRPMPRNSLRGFATIELPSGLTISDISVHVSHDKAWASLPAKPQINSDGTARRGDDGKVLYA